MAFAETANLVVNLSLKGNFAQQLKTSQKALGDFSAKLTQTETRAYKAGQQIGTGIKNAMKIAAVGVGLLAANVAAGLNSLIKLDDVVAQTNAVLKSTKDASGQTAQSIRDMANGFENLNAQMDDTVIQSGANVLATFVRIQKDAFEPALEAALNLSTALHTDLQSAVIAVGRALNDPVKGLTLLTRKGVLFTDEQKDIINGLVGTGNALKNFRLAGVELTKSQEKLVKSFGPYVDTMEAVRLAHIKLTPAQRKLFKGMKDGSGVIEAQKVILAELDKEFGGSFLAGGETTAGKVARFKDKIDDLQRVLAQGMLPVIDKISDRLSDFLADPAVIASVNKLGTTIAGLFNDENINAAGSALTSVFQIVRSTAPLLQQVAGGLVKVVTTAVDLFRQLPEPIQKLAIGAFAINKITGGLVTNIAGGLISTILGSLKSAVVNIQAANVNVAGGGLGAGGGGGGSIIGALGVAGLIVAAAVPIGKAFADALPPELKGVGGAGKTDSQLARERADAASGRFTGAGKAADDVDQVRLARLSNIAAASVAGAFAGALARVVDETRAKLRRLTATEAKILGGLDPRAGRGFRVAQRTFIQGHTNHDAIVVADAFAYKFANSQKPFYRSQQNAENALRALKGLQQRFLARGDTKSAARIGRDIQTMRNVLKTAAHGTTKAIENKKLSVHVATNVSVSQTINSRKYQAAIHKDNVVVNGKERS